MNNHVLSVTGLFVASDFILTYSLKKFIHIQTINYLKFTSVSYGKLQDQQKEHS